MPSIAIVLLSMLTCVVYGIVHDQITARICVEYFTIGHPPVFDTEDPTLLGLGWGIFATWWVGLFLGILLAISSRIGRWPQLSASSLLRPLMILAGGSACFALLAGLAGYVAASLHWVILVPPRADQVPAEKHIPYLVDLWAHSASYFAGVVGSLILIVLVLLKRQREHLTGGTGCRVELD